MKKLEMLYVPFHGSCAFSGGSHDTTEASYKKNESRGKVRYVLPQVSECIIATRVENSKLVIYEIKMR